jgi:hypothetical protein
MDQHKNQESNIQKEGGAYEMFVNIDQWSVQVSNVFIVPTCLILLI